MQPRFPPDHHFHRRSGSSRPAEATKEPFDACSQGFADRAASYLSRQCLPAFDASDPRGTP